MHGWEWQCTVRTLRLDQGLAGLGRGLRRWHRQWPEAAAPARAVGAKVRGSDCCARLVVVQCYSRARVVMGARARALARRVVTGGSVLEWLGATRAPGTDAGHEQERLRGWWLTTMVALGGWGSRQWWKCD